MAAQEKCENFTADMKLLTAYQWHIVIRIVKVWKHLGSRDTYQRVNQIYSKQPCN